MACSHNDSGRLVRTGIRWRYVCELRICNCQQSGCIRRSNCRNHCCRRHLNARTGILPCCSLQKEHRPGPWKRNWLQRIQHLPHPGRQCHNPPTCNERHKTAGLHNPYALINPGFPLCLHIQEKTDRPHRRRPPGLPLHSICNTYNNGAVRLEFEIPTESRSKNMKSLIIKDFIFSLLYFWRVFGEILLLNA